MIKTIGNKHKTISEPNPDNTLELIEKPSTEVSEYLKIATARFVQRYHYLTRKCRKIIEKTIDDFTFYQCLGSGAFADVYLAEDKTNHNYYAIKVLNKKKIIKHQQEEHVMSEKRLLSAVKFPFIIDLAYSFQSASFLYLALEFMLCGELFGYLRKEMYFTENNARFFSAQVLLALEYLHHLNIAYRDLKPENILVGNDGYLKIADFGFAKLVPNRTYTLCGTPEYLAPEIITHKGYSRSVDWWAFGVLVYELNAGYSPFYAEKSKQMFENIMIGKFTFPRHFTQDLRVLLSRLLEPDISKRIGCLKKKVDDIKQQRWFRSRVVWNSLFNKQLVPPTSFIKYRQLRKFHKGSVTILSNDSNTDYKEVFDGF